MADKRRQRSDPRTLLAKAGKGRRAVKYASNQTIFAQGDTADAIFYVQRGRVKVSVVSEQGKEAVIAIVGANEFFGEACLAGRLVRISTATTLLESEIIRLEKPVALKLIRDEPAFSEMFTSHLMNRAMRVEADLVDHIFNSSEKRLARILLLLSNFGKDGKSEVISPAINQVTLAEMVGTTRSRVSFFMNKFRRLGFIEYNGDIQVNNSLLNIILYDLPQTEE